MAFFTQTIYTQQPFQSYTMRLGNYVFDTNLSLFGVMKQRVISKINRQENILKLRNNDTYDSVYPMLDE